MKEQQTHKKQVKLGIHHHNNRLMHPNDGKHQTDQTQSSAPIPKVPTSVVPVVTMKLGSKKTMYENFQPWVLRTYGDSAKTKTITMKKCTRIIKTLLGEELTNAENSKFRFWVKSKGFVLKVPIEFNNHMQANNNEEDKERHPAETEVDDEDRIEYYLQGHPELFVPTMVKVRKTYAFTCISLSLLLLIKVIHSQSYCKSCLNLS